jgi:xylulokinase
MAPIYPALIFNDSRAVKEAKEAVRIVGEDRLATITGNTSDAYFGFTKMLWIKNNLPGVWERTFKFATPNGYAAYLLTGTAATFQKPTILRCATPTCIYVFTEIFLVIFNS